MIGHSLALFLVENLLLALSKLNELEYENVETLLSRLQEEEVEDQIRENDLEEYARKLYPQRGIDFDPTIFFTDKSMCHTARLPSQTRYLGYLTNTEKVGGPAPMGKETVSTDCDNTRLRVSLGYAQTELTSFSVIF